jgi:hypothetical protein
MEKKIIATRCTLLTCSINFSFLVSKIDSFTQSAFISRCAPLIKSLSSEIESAADVELQTTLILFATCSMEWNEVIVFEIRYFKNTLEDGWSGIRA